MHEQCPNITFCIETIFHYIKVFRRGTQAAALAQGRGSLMQPPRCNKA